MPYEYADRDGIVSITWDRFHGLCKGLAAAAASFAPDVILAVGRGGFYPGTLIAHILRVEVYPVRLSRRVRDEVVHQAPQWIVRPSESVRGQRVLIVDEISDSGETFNVVRAEVNALGAAETCCAALYAHTWGADAVDYVGMISDALILNPWDREIFAEGIFQPHPEYVGAFKHQGKDAADYMLPIEMIPADKTVS